MTSEAMTRAAPDYDEIVRVVQLYPAGFNDRDAGKLREAFHEDAWMFFTREDGILHTARIWDVVDLWAAGEPDDPPHRVTGRIISVTQAGDVASVLLGWDWYKGKDFSFVEFHTMLRIEGVWKITNKTATRTSRAGGLDSSAWPRSPGGDPGSWVTGRA